MNSLAGVSESSSGNSFFLMRFPHSEICYCSGFRPVHDACTCHDVSCESLSFVIKGYKRGAPIITFPVEFTLRSNDAPSTGDFNRMLEIAVENEAKCQHSPFQDLGISDEQHEQIVGKCIDYLKKASEDGSERKIVMSRCNAFYLSYSQLKALLLRLLATRPDALIFFFSTPETGTWLGATPELLLSVTDKRLYSMSLAGTRASGSIDTNSDEEESKAAKDKGESWDFKNLQEQRIVTDEITKTLHAFGPETQTEGPFTVRAGNVEHLCTRIYSTVKENLTTDEMLAIASSLSPTPALCGYPREEAEAYIDANELHDRELYGGFLGLTDTASGGVDIFANLRSGRYNPVTERFCAFAGGGITPFSDAKAEVKETRRKLQWFAV